VTPDPGDPASLPALAVQISTLRREVTSLAASLSALTSTQHEHATAVADITELRSQLDHILAALTPDAQPLSPPWFWLTMTQQDRDEKDSELCDWVDTVLRTQYPSYLTGQIRPCWPRHPEARWELTCLYQLWTQAYLSTQPSTQHAAEWHDRWLPGVLHRLAPIMRHCDPTCQRQPIPNIRSLI
jgi:hypothetical protein